MGQFIKHIPCPLCGSSDAGALYEDNSAFCFSCYKPFDTEPDSEGALDTQVQTKETTKPKAFLEGSYQDIPNRGLKETTCRKYGYTVGEYKGTKCHIANYTDPSSGKVASQKIRLPGKEFLVIGGGKDMPLYGQNLWSPGKSVVITEGEIDALSVAQAFSLKWPVVSLPNGAQSAVAAIQRKGTYEWLLGFDKIVLCFDMDEKGQAAALKVAAVLPAGKVYMMSLPYKDANETMLEAGEAAITQAFWNAKLWRPDGIFSVEELRKEVLTPEPIPCIPYPFSGLNAKIRGIHDGELITITSGSGLGKSTFLRELAYDLLVNEGQTVGGMFLEESTSETIEYLMGIHLNQNLAFYPDAVTLAERVKAFDFIAQQRLYLWDHFGSNDIDDVINKMRYMVQGLGCKRILLDHISILVSGIDSGDERKTIDVGMTKLKTFTQETKATVIAVSHLKRPNGDKGHEDGAKVHLGQLRGSHSIAQLSNTVIGLEKDEDDPNSDDIVVQVLKARRGGRRGEACRLTYNHETGRLTEADF